MFMIAENSGIITQILDLLSKENIVLNRNKDLFSLVTQIRSLTDELARTIIRTILQVLDHSLIESPARKRDWIIQRRNQAKTVATTLGPITYERTYFKNRHTGEYAYLLDEQIGVTPHQRASLDLQHSILKAAHQQSYQKTVDQHEYSGITSKTTVMNYVHKLGGIESSECAVPEKKKVVKRLYIEADEDHVATQRSGNQQLKLIYVHEGRERVGKKRHRLIHPHYFVGFYQKRSDELWFEVLTYLDANYDLDQVEEISLSGDGAGWIKGGLEVIPRSKYYLDRFHLEKYIKRAVAPVEAAKGLKADCYWMIRDALSLDDREAFTTLIDSMMGYGLTRSSELAVVECKKYILNNWEGIQNTLAGGNGGCSAEGHVSHILSSRLSSRPMGWSLKGAENIARLRVFELNHGDLAGYLIAKAKAAVKEKRIVKLEKRIVRKASQYMIKQVSINYATPHFGYYKA